MEALFGQSGNVRGVKSSHPMAQVFERVMLNRMKPLFEEKQSPCGFVTGSATDGIQALEAVIEKCKDNLHVIFITLVRSYDKVPRDLTWAALRYYRMPDKLFKLIQSMYDGATETVLGSSVSIPFTCGLKQDSVISPFLFSAVMNLLASKIKNKPSLSLLSADNIVLVSDDYDCLRKSSKEWCQVLENNGMTFETEYLMFPMGGHAATNSNLKLNGQSECTNFKHLGSVVEKLHREHQPAEEEVNQELDKLEI